MVGGKSVNHGFAAFVFRVILRVDRSNIASQAYLGDLFLRVSQAGQKVSRVVWFQMRVAMLLLRPRVRHSALAFCRMGWSLVRDFSQGTISLPRSRKCAMTNSGGSPAL